MLRVSRGSPPSQRKVCFEKADLAWAGHANTAFAILNAMASDRAESGAAQPAVDLLVARDAYGSVTVLALLLFLWEAVYLAVERVLPLWPFGAARIFLATAAAVVFAYFLRTWKRPSRSVAVRFSLIVFGVSLAFI